MTLRGADVLARSLAAAGLRRVFTLSGNHVMPVFDAALDAGLDLVHVRHEAAAVHMADAWARLTGEAGIALVTGGPGHANAVGALYTALMSESPVVLLSGHAPLGELGKGSFQEMAQAELARPLVKAAWTAQSAAGLGDDIARAVRIARSGRPGPVHLSLPTDALESTVDDGAAAVRSATAFSSSPVPLAQAQVREVLGALAKAARPLLIAGAQLADRKGRLLLARFERASGIPAFVMESPRGVNDPSLGLLAEVLGKADCAFLLAKPVDFTLRFGAAFDAACRAIPLAPGAEARPTLEALAALAEGGEPRSDGWLDEVRTLLDWRPTAWTSLASAPDGPVHPVELGRGVAALLARDPESVFVSDGGEIGQWMQACVGAPHRVINGVAGAIGAALPFGIAAKLARPGSTVVAAMGDGTFGFHLAELDTAVRHGVAVLVVVGNDAAWNAEHQIQLRTYGKDRAHGCELLPSRYERVAEALGGHGEYVSKAADLPAALERAVKSGKPACVNVAIQRLPAPSYRR